MQPQQKSHYNHLKEKWTKRHHSLHEKLLSKHGKAIAWLSSNSKHLIASGGAALMLLTAPHPLSLPLPHVEIASGQVASVKNIDKKAFLISDLSNLLPKEVRPLTLEEEKSITDVLSRDLSIKVTGELEGKRLNRSYGLIGKEQHLAIYPGDNISSHFDDPQQARLYAAEGMAPGRGAWGYFATGSAVTKEDRLREKYYIAVPTFLSEGFNQRFAEYRDFYKYRKMLVVNPQNGKAIVVVIGDAGPAVWTGKHLGGSPEVMHYLERVDGKGVGPVLYFFIDESNGEADLGPVEL